MVVLGIEVVATLLGLWMLITGKGWGKAAIAHWQYRLLGTFLITLVPLVFIIGLSYYFIYAFNHRDLPEEQIQQNIRWPITGVELACCILYVVVASIWERRIRAKGAPANAPSDAGLA